MSCTTAAITCFTSRSMLAEVRTECLHTNQGSTYSLSCKYRTHRWRHLTALRVRPQRPVWVSRCGRARPMVLYFQERLYTGAADSGGQQGQPPPLGKCSGGKTMFLPPPPSHRDLKYENPSVHRTVKYFCQNYNDSTTAIQSIDFNHSTRAW